LSVYILTFSYYILVCYFLYLFFFYIK